MNLGDLNKVWEVRALKRKERQEEATHILEKIAKQVQPIMHKHKWRVKLLSEMCPTNASLLGLNVNRGVHVKLRLRRPNRDLEFYPFDQVLDTMLHELCHNVHGPHDAKFYKLWDELRKECEELMSKGVTGTGEGFDLPGRRVGSVTHQPPLSSLRKTQLAAAEKRAVLGSLMPSGPMRLGGDRSMMAALSPVQAAAMAAERRYQDDRWCGSASYGASEDGECNSGISEDRENIGTNAGCSSSRLHEGAKAQTSDTLSQKRSRIPDNSSCCQSYKVHLASNFVDLSEDVLVSETMNLNFRAQKRSRETEQSSIPPSNCNKNSKFMDIPDTSSSGSKPHNSGTHSPDEAALWQCGTCTLLNPPLAPVCELCSTHRPKDVGTNYKFWSCTFCTLENSAKLEKCSACDQWRYSHGPQIATQAPNLGT